MDFSYVALNRNLLWLKTHTAKHYIIDDSNAMLLHINVIIL